MIPDFVMEEALRLYQKDWVKTKHNSFMPDIYVFKNVMSVKDVMPYIVIAGDTIRMKMRIEKLKKIRNKING